MSSHPQRSQPQRHSDHMTTNPQQLSGKRYAVVPPGLEGLIEAEELILKKKVFQTRGGQQLFFVSQVSECCGPSLNLYLRNFQKRNVIKIHLTSSGNCCGGYSHVQVDAPQGHPIGFVKSCYSTGIPKFSIHNENNQPIFTVVCEDPIEVISVTEGVRVAWIKKEKSFSSTKVIFHFPMDMEAQMKAVILGAFLYLNFQLQRNTSSDSGLEWADNDIISWDVGGGGSDWGGDAGDYGGGGGDCGGSGGDCGGGGGDCGGGGGDGGCGGD
ncbi:phospholipid scramblase 1 [Bombina bombina]|uniref:phospholipid scramblase 1 n=1 Tax=Bombina bombina TaxID=8345 RepID=UPI00235AA491|nr:phospholipid scramblase 1 [Bombina bombina]